MAPCAAGWSRDAAGRYRFDTIRPGAYPSRNVAEHVHMHVIEPGMGTYYIENLEFEDDPLNSNAPREAWWQSDSCCRCVGTASGTVVDIVLGRNIPGYPQR